jgi:hypothetical protein
MEENKYLCNTCNFEIQPDSDFCPRCGTIFIEEVKCEDHPEIEAEGVCVICKKLCCNKCGYKGKDVFLCNEHYNTETYQGLAKVYGTFDEIQVQFLKQCLEDKGLHPFIFSKKSTALHLGGIDHTIIDSVINPGKNDVMNEIKLLIPFTELIEAREIIDDLEL